MLKWCDTNTMSDTPRTDAAHEATLTPEYEYEGAEHVAWEFARKLERELADLDWGSFRASITDNDIDKVFAKHWHDRAEYASEGLSNITSAKVT